VKDEATVSIPLSNGESVAVAVKRMSFQRWTGVMPASDWNGKPVVGPPHRPFSELQILASREFDGWKGAWVYRPRQFLSSWEPRAFIQPPAKMLALHDQLLSLVGRTSGCWDLFCWRNGKVLFVESKWPDLGDKVKQSQVAWLQAGLSSGLVPSAFLIVECRLV